MRHPVPAALLACLALTLPAAAALADGGILTVSPGAIATTGNATSITSSSAVFNGVVITTGADAQWVFQYGPAGSSGQSTAAQDVGPGARAVSVTVTGLAAGTHYDFRLVVRGGSSGVGGDFSFTTPRPTAQRSTAR